MMRPAPGFKDAVDVLARRQVGGHHVRALGRATLIRTKEAAGRAKDLAVLAILRKTLEESAT